MDDPVEILLTCGRCYAYRGRYLQVQVFTKYLTEVNHLEKRFGGKHYKHLSGFVWQISSRQKLVQLIDELREHFPSENGFEVPIIQNYC